MSSNSIIRMGSAHMYDSSLRNIGARQSSLVDLNEKLTSGKRVLHASDDPVAAAQAERAMTRIERIQVEQRSLDAQRNVIAQAESSLGDAVGLVQEIRELLISAGNGAHNSTDRATIANQLQSLRDQLLGVANRKDTNGVPLLNALGSPSIPFAGAAPAFGGLPGQVTGTDTAIAGALDGHAAYTIPADGATPSESLFNALDTAIGGIRNAPDSSAAMAAVTTGLGQLDRGLDQLQTVRGYAGELLNQADRITGDQEKRSIQLEADRSRAEDMDLVKGLSEFQSQQVGYEAALKTYSMVQKLSLFNYIS